MPVFLDVNTEKIFDTSHWRIPKTNVYIPHIETKDFYVDTKYHKKTST